MAFFLNLLDLDTWVMANNDTGDVIEGQFYAQNLQENVSSTWTQHTSLSRSKAIFQFLKGDTDSVNFEAKLFNGDAFKKNAQRDLALLKSWVKKDDDLGRPPILTFWVSDGQTVTFADCIMPTIGGIRHSRPDSLGGLREVVLNITLIEYSDYEVEGVFETRYHRAKEQDYYEMLTYIEYSSALLGDVIRKRHPDKAIIETGDIIKLPSIQAIRTEKITQDSIQLRTAYGKRPTDQKKLRQDVFDRRNRTYVSHIIKEEL